MGVSDMSCGVCTTFTSATVLSSTYRFDSAATSCTDVFPKAVGRGQHLPYTHVISITLPHEDQQVRGSQPGGMHEQIYDCTPVVMEQKSIDDNTVAGTNVTLCWGLLPFSPDGEKQQP